MDFLRIKIVLINHIPKKSEIFRNSGCGKLWRRWRTIFISRTVIITIRTSKIRFGLDVLIGPEVWHKNIDQQDEFSKRNVCIAKKSIFPDREFFIANLAIKKMVTTIRVNCSELSVTTFTIGRSWENVVILNYLKLRKIFTIY